MAKAKVVINVCVGAFSISAAAVRRGRKISGDKAWGDCVLKGERCPDGSVCTKPQGYHLPHMPRHDKVLVQVVKELAELANGPKAKLRVVTVDKGAMYRIRAVYGKESVMVQSNVGWTKAD